MKMTFRWYGYNDKNKLEYIRQIPGMTGVVTALYSVPVGGSMARTGNKRIKRLYRFPWIRNGSY